MAGYATYQAPEESVGSTTKFTPSTCNLVLWPDTRESPWMAPPGTLRRAT
ncbi:hypothetical protein EYZ11_010047 [Aspergillus tanneri]|uniref:Uncharacterized protein n=1 Tax=Aspergillus tanneri TaxID=1220188 RepID=A0A4S3JBQ9_9EURO|nr:hypothetical protein EYZ11_010047 [Aspergillus tanneri]